VLMIASDHGFHWQEGRPAQLSSAAAATAGRWHRDEGIYLLWGPGVPASSERGRGGVLQVCGTLMSLLGMPPSGGVAGPPLPGVEASPSLLVDYRRHWRPAAPPSTTDEKANQEEIEKLRALGYLGSHQEKATSRGTGSTRTAASYDNEGLLLRERGETDAAARAFERALALDPESAAALWNLSDLLHSRRQDLDRSDDLLIRALAAGLPDGVDYTAGRAVTYARDGEAERSLRLLDRALAARSDPRLHLLRGRYHLERHHCQEALADFRAAAAPGNPRNALAHASSGLARLCLGDPAGAVRDFRQSLAIDPHQPEIQRALGELEGHPNG
jgi:Flp pilus assembly protein TadD